MHHYFHLPAGYADRYASDCLRTNKSILVCKSNHPPAGLFCRCFTLSVLSVDIQQKDFLFHWNTIRNRSSHFIFCFLFLYRRHSQSIPLFLLLLATRFFGDTYLCLTKRVYIPVTIQSGLSDRRRNQLQFLPDTFIYYTHIHPNGYSVSMAHALDDKCPRHFLHHYCA